MGSGKESPEQSCHKLRFTHVLADVGNDKPRDAGRGKGEGFLLVPTEFHWEVVSAAFGQLPGSANSLPAVHGRPVQVVEGVEEPLLE